MSYPMSLSRQFALSREEEMRSFLVWDQMPFGAGDFIAEWFFYKGPTYLAVVFGIDPLRGSWFYHCFSKVVFDEQFY